MYEAIRLFDLKPADVETLRSTGELKRDDGLQLKYGASIPELDGAEGVYHVAIPPKYDKRLKRHKRQIAKASRRRNRK